MATGPLVVANVSRHSAPDRRTRSRTGASAMSNAPGSLCTDTEIGVKASSETTAGALTARRTGSSGVLARASAQPRAQVPARAPVMKKAATAAGRPAALGPVLIRRRTRGARGPGPSGAPR